MRTTSLCCALLAGAFARALAEQCSSSESCSAKASFGDSLLQVRQKIEKVVVNEESEQESEHYIQLDGVTKTAVPRREVEGSFVRETLIKYPLSGIGSGVFEVKDGQLTINFNIAVEGRISRSGFASRDSSSVLEDPREQSDYGVKKDIWVASPRGGVFSRKATIGVMEKEHSLYVPDGVSRVSETREKAAMKAQKQNQSVARMYSAHRNMAVSTTSFMASSQTQTQGEDLKHVAALRAMVAASNDVDAALQEKMVAANALFKTNQGLRTSIKPLRSVLACMHFEAELMEGDSDSATIALDKRVVAYRALNRATPNQDYQVNTGIAVFHHDAEADTLDVYFGFSTSMDLVETADGFAAQFFVGPTDGVSANIVPEGRPAASPLPEQVSWAWAGVQSMPTDYTFMHSTRDQLLCDNDVLDTLPMVAYDGAMAVMRMRYAKTPQERMEAAPLINQVVLNLNTIVTCGVEYMRPVSNAEVVSYGRLQALVMLHMMLEMPGATIHQALYQENFWNDYNLL